MPPGWRRNALCAHEPRPTRHRLDVCRRSHTPQLTGHSSHSHLASSQPPPGAAPASRSRRSHASVSRWSRHPHVWHVCGQRRRAAASPLQFRSRLAQNERDEKSEQSVGPEASESSDHPGGRSISGEDEEVEDDEEEEEEEEEEDEEEEWGELPCAAHVPSPSSRELPSHVLSSGLGVVVLERASPVVNDDVASKTAATRAKVAASNSARRRPAIYIE